MDDEVLKSIKAGNGLPPLHTPEDKTVPVKLETPEDTELVKVLRLIHKDLVDIKNTIIKTF